MYVHQFILEEFFMKSFSDQISADVKPKKELAILLAWNIVNTIGLLLLGLIVLS